MGLYWNTIATVADAERDYSSAKVTPDPKPDAGSPTSSLAFSRQELPPRLATVCRPHQISSQSSKVTRSKTSLDLHGVPIADAIGTGTQCYSAILTDEPSFKF